MSEALDCVACTAATDQMPLRCLDPCITKLVLALNATGFPTTASCCGHGVRPAMVMLTDGRELLVLRDWKEARTLDHLWPPIHEEATP